MSRISFHSSAKLVCAIALVAMLGSVANAQSGSRNNMSAPSRSAAPAQSYAPVQSYAPAQSYAPGPAYAPTSQFSAPSRSGQSASVFTTPPAYASPAILGNTAYRAPLSGYNNSGCGSFGHSYSPSPYSHNAYGSGYSRPVFGRRLNHGGSCSGY